MGDAQEGVVDVDQQLGVSLMLEVGPLVGAGQGEPPLMIVVLSRVGVERC
jgi:hypothetical protein